MQDTRKLKALKSTPHFPIAEWKKRGLTPSDTETIGRMDREVEAFITILLDLLEKKPFDVEEHIQGWFEEWDGEGFDTEEREFVVDKMLAIMESVGLNTENLML